MMTGPNIQNVAYDAARRRFIADIAVSAAGKTRTMQVSTPGHPAWGYRRIVTALTQAIAKFQTEQGMSHARA